MMHQHFFQPNAQRNPANALNEYQLTSVDNSWLRQTFIWANAARLRGNRPFGAVVATSQGRILAEAFSNTQETGDCTGHAEMNAIRQISKAKYSLDVLEDATLYVSAEPCTMCASAICISGLRRVVYGLDRQSLQDLQSSVYINILSCDDIFSHAKETIECLGPCLVQEAWAVYQNDWFSTANDSTT